MADQVNAESKSLDPAKVALTLLMVVPFVLGWLVGLAFRAAWSVLAWVWTAAVVGFRTARGPDLREDESS
jgi:hypothetical protein